MQQMDIIINQIIVILLLALLGYLAGRFKYLPENAGLYVSKLVIKVTAPSLIIATMSAYDFTEKTLRDGISISLATLCFLGVSFLVGLAAGRLMKLEGAKENVFRAHLMFGNVGYLALPLLKSIFGEKGLVYAVFFIIAHDVLVWTVGVYLLNKHKEPTLKENMKQFVNANTISYVLGLAFAFMNFHRIVEASPAATAVYNILYSVLNPVGNMTLYLVMIFIGLTLAENKVEKLRELFEKHTTLILALLKLLVIPALAFFVLSLFGSLVDSFVKVILVLELAMPCAAIIPALAVQYGSDHRLATDNVIYTTFFSMITLPIFMYLLNIAGG